MTLALLITAATGAWADGDTKYTVTFKANGNTKTVENVTLPHTFELDPIIKELYPSLSGGNGSPAGTSASGNTNVTAYNNNSKHYASISAPFEGAVTVTGQFFKDFTNNQYTLEINCMENLVAISDDKTEATIKMPASDVDVSYELVRDITQKVNVETRIDGAVTERIRIAKDNDGHYKFVTKQGWQFAAVDKLDNNKDLTNGELTYTLKMKVGNEYVAKNFDTELCPGTWRLEATANAEKPYEGTAYGPDIELYAGYEITVPAGEYATFYKDENLYTEDEHAELYTISEVNATQAVLSDAVQIMPKNTPMLVYNKGTEEKTFLLIPTEDEANQVTAANEFKGTLSTMGMPGSTSITDYYVCTGKAFRWVKNAGTIGANKCWLQIGEQPATTRANTRSIVGGGNTTGIDGIENDESAVEGYYDLNGRKLQGKPTRGGIYIQNGRKVIVR